RRHTIFSRDWSSDVCSSDLTLVIPQFVLKELQFVADSSDALKRNRGRRGLDILQKVQKMTNLDVVISDVDFPDVKEVDLKLIERSEERRVGKACRARWAVRH